MRAPCFAVAALLVCLATPAVRGTAVPMLVVDDERQLIAVDVGTGEAQLIGTAAAWFSDLAFSPSNELYAVNNRQLWTLDWRVYPPALHGSLIGYHGFGVLEGGYQIDALTFGDDGVLYAAGDDILISIDTTTAQGTRIGSLSGYRSAGDLAFDAMGRLLMTTDVGALIEVHTDGTGATYIGDLTCDGGVCDDVYALDTADDGALYGIRATNDIVMIDPVTGATTPLSVLDAGVPVGAVWGGSFPDHYVPEPTTLLLALTGAAVVLCRRRKRTRRAGLHRS